MTAFVFKSEEVWPRVVDARERGDANAEAIALAVLGQSLFEEGRHDEAYVIMPSVARLAVQPTDLDAVRTAQAKALAARGERLAREAGALGTSRGGGANSADRRRRYRLLTSASYAFMRAGQALSSLDDSHRDAADEAYGRCRIMELRRDGRGPGCWHETASHRLRWSSLFNGLTQGSHIAVYAGFAAAAEGGPHVIQLGQGLGQSVGETTARAMGRIFLRTGFIGGYQELVVDLSGIRTGDLAQAGWLSWDEAAKIWHLELPAVLQEQLPSRIELRAPLPEHRTADRSTSPTAPDITAKLDHLDAVWRHIEEVRRLGDSAAEAVALALLSQALFQCGRAEEAEAVFQDATGLARRHSASHKVLRAQASALQNLAVKLERTWVHPLSPKDRSQQAKGSAVSRREAAMSAASHAYSRVYQVLTDLGDHEGAEQSYARYEITRSRNAPAYRTEIHFRAYLGWDGAPGPEPGYLLLEPKPVEIVVAGFVALKFVGPLLEEFAKKLGQQLGESTVKALSRIFLRWGDGPGVEMKAGETTILLPRELTDEMKLAIIGLDLTDPAIYGATLGWDPDNKALQILKPPPRKALKKAKD